MLKVAKKKLLQAYPNAPWRSQAQMIGVIAIGIVITAILASVYLAVSVNAANLGRETQELQLEILELQRENANLETRLAVLTSSSVMKERADKLGFRQLTSWDLEYLSVPGYVHAQEVMLAPAPAPSISIGYQYPAELNETLFDWLQEQLDAPNTFSGMSNLFNPALPAAPPEP